MRGYCVMTPPWLCKLCNVNEDVNVFGQVITYQYVGSPKTLVDMTKIEWTESYFVLKCPTHPCLEGVG